MTASFTGRVVQGPPRPVFVLAVAGEIDHAGLRELREQLSRVVAESAPDDRGSEVLEVRSATVVVDLRATTFVSGAALGVLARQRDRTGARVRLVLGERGVLRRALAAMGLEGELDVYDDLADAVLADAPRED